MGDHKVAVVGIGATGAVVAAALLGRYPDSVLVDPKLGWAEALTKKGISVSGQITYEVPVKRFVSSIDEIKALDPNLIFVCTKTFHLQQVLEELKGLVKPGTKIISTHNGLGTEDVVAEEFGADAAFRMSLNFGVSLKAPGEVEVAFFNRPNYLGALTDDNRELGLEMARVLTEGGLDTQFVDDIKLHVWRKMIHKCSLSSICAVTDRSIGEILEYPPVREIADACFNEAMAVSKAMGYDLGENYIEASMGYLEKAKAHKDSMCYDLANKTPTEIDFLGGKIVEYGRTEGVPTPYFVTMTNLVKALEDSYLSK
ncbi:MAG: ketopantoate reductase family protein [Desulfobacteraceae bacterium]|jgi:2-dehydropantoate 2-reductase